MTLSLEMEKPEKKTKEDIPIMPGVIGIASATMGRYREFDISLQNIAKPVDTRIEYEVSSNVALSYNNMCQYVLDNKNYGWLWIMGDDHVFHPDILYRLLSRNVDIVAPLCLARNNPFLPVIRHDIGSGVKGGRVGWDFIRGKTGLMEVEFCGNAGMLIRRNVIEKIGSFWHTVGDFQKDVSAPDLSFCKRVREHGFKIHVDLDNPIGHIASVAVWPVKDKSSNYGAAMHSPVLNMPKQEKSLVGAEMHSWSVA